MEYIKADDVRSIIDEIEPCNSEYYGAGVGVTETMMLDKQQEIADMLKNLEVVEVEDE